MRLQREDLERRVADVERFSSQLAEKEEEVRVLKEAAGRAATERTGLEADLERLKASLKESHLEVRQLKAATKEAARMAQDLAETRTKAQELEKDVKRLKVCCFFYHWMCNWVNWNIKASARSLILPFGFTVPTVPTCSHCTQRCC